MSSKLLHFLPQGSDGSIRVKPSSDLWSSDGRRLEFLESWFVQSYCDDEDLHRNLNWGAISGMALSLTVSGVFWAGVVLLVERFWK